MSVSFKKDHFNCLWNKMLWIPLQPKEDKGLVVPVRPPCSQDPVCVYIIEGNAESMTQKCVFTTCFLQIQDIPEHRPPALQTRSRHAREVLNYCLHACILNSKCDGAWAPFWMIGTIAQSQLLFSSFFVIMLQEAQFAEERNAAVRAAAAAAVPEVFIWFHLHLHHTHCFNWFCFWISYCSCW